MEDFGARVASVWQGLRSTTRSLVEKALQSPGSGAGAAATTSGQPPRNESRPYDASAIGSEQSAGRDDERAAKRARL